MMVVVVMINNICNLWSACQAPGLTGSVLFICVLFYSNPINYVTITVIPTHPRFPGEKIRALRGATAHPGPHV